MRRYLSRLMVTLVLVLSGVLLPLSPPAQATERPGNPVIFAGVSGLTFEQLSPQRTPNLWSLVERGAIATLTPRSVHTTSCPVDGWLAVSSGRRAADESRPTCRIPEVPIDGWTPDWAVYKHRAEQDNYGAVPGTLAEVAKEANASITAINPGAAIGAALPGGAVKHWEPAADDLAEQVREAARTSDIVLVDLGNLHDSTASLAEVDQQVGALLQAFSTLHSNSRNKGAGDTSPTLMVASFADGWTDHSSMQFIAALGDDFPTGILTSGSTQQPGLVQSTDILPTIVDVAGIKATVATAGAPMRAIDTDASAATRYQLMVDRQVAVSTQQALSAWFFPVLAGIYALCIAAGILLYKYRGGRGGTQQGDDRRLSNQRNRDWVLRNARWLGIFFTAVPVSTFLVNLVPWERSTSPDIAMVGALVGFAAIISALALLGPWRNKRLGPVTCVAVITTVVLLADVIAGSPLQMSTLLGEPLLIASRFYGIGNSALALYCTALVFVLVAACSALHKRTWRVACVIAGLAVSAVVLATPGLGTKFGSVPTLTVGLSIFALSVAQIRVSRKRFIMVLGGAVALMLTVLVADWLRPREQWTHFGRFFDALLTGQAGEVLLRKIGMNIDILTQSWMTLLLPFIIAGVFWVALSPKRFRVPYLEALYQERPLLRSGLASLLVLMVVGTVINDSGIVLPAVSILFVIPALAHLVGQEFIAKDMENFDA